MKIARSNKIQYVAPQAELTLVQPLKLLAALSVYGNIEDYIEGGEYEGEYVDPLD